MRIESRSTQKRIWATCLSAGVALLALVLGVGFTFAGDSHPAGNSAKGFKAPLSYFPAPHETNMQSLLEGAESETGPGGIIILHNAKLQMFREDGSPEMIVKAPQCNYDYNARIASSTGALQVETWDDARTRAFEVRGTNGFYWQQTNSLLIVSNKQMTTISGPLTNSFNP